MSKEQWVNLPRESKFVEDKIKKKRRLDFVRIIVKFKKESLSTYRLKINKVGGNDFEDYEVNEKRRNINFQIRGMPGVVTNDGKKEIACTYDIYLNAAGDNEYEIEATHKGKTVTGTWSYKSRRKLFYQVMKMRGCPTVPMTKMEDEFWKPARKHYIEMKKKGAESTVKFIPCLDGSNATEFIKESAKGYTLKTHKPFAFGITFVNYAATPEDKSITRSIDFTLPSRAAQRRLGTQTLTFDVGSQLWFELDPDDDARKRWYRRIWLWFEPDSNPAAKQYVRIRKRMVEPTGAKLNTYGGRRELKITFPQNTIRRNASTEKEGKWKVRMDLTLVRGFSAGFAYNGINLLGICTKVWWRDKELSGAPQVVVHEVGHKVGMAAHGDRLAYGDTVEAILDSFARKNTLPNSHSDLYGDIRGTNNQDHLGPHCAKGASWDPTKARGERWSGNPGCVMFGATSLGGTASPITFCSDCSKNVRKLDLTGPSLKLGGFKISMEEW